MYSSAQRQPPPIVLTLKLGVAAVALLAVGFDVCFPFAEPKEVSRYNAAMGRAKRCGASMNLYALENSDTYPYVQQDEALYRVVSPYFVSQSTKGWYTANPGKPGRFTMNYSLAGVDAQDVMEPQETPMILDRFGRHPYRSNDWDFLTCFADGHAEYVPEAQWPPFRGNLNLKLKRHGKPLKLALPDNQRTIAGDKSLEESDLH